MDAIRTNPHAADGCLELVGLAQYLTGDYDEVLLAFGKSEHSSLFTLTGMAACYAQLGRFEQAARIGREFVAASNSGAPEGDQVYSEYWQSYWNRVYKFKDTKDRQHLLDGLKKAGIPVG